MNYRLSLNLPTLHCYRQHDEHGNSEPYLWTAVFYYDYQTLQSEAKFQVIVPGLGNNIPNEFRNNVNNNEDVAIPTSLGNVVIFLDDELISEYVKFGVVFLLLEQDTTPEDAVVAGHRAFAASLQRQMTHFFIGHRMDPIDTLEILEISTAAENAAKHAMHDKLSFLRRLFPGNQDDFIGTSALTFSGMNDIRSNSGLEMAFPLIENAGNEYLIKGARFVLSPVVTDACATQQQNEILASQALNGEVTTIADLKHQYAAASGSQKQILKLEIIAAEARLPGLQAALNQAQTVLKACRLAHHV